MFWWHFLWAEYHKTRAEQFHIISTEPCYGRGIQLKAMAREVHHLKKQLYHGTALAS